MENEIEIILFVADQNRSKLFYEKVLSQTPCLDVPGMTEFKLGTNLKLGLMPETGIQRILNGKTPDPKSGNGIPRCELYLLGTNAREYFKRALDAGASEISEVQPRDWYHTVGYVMDFDGHILAFAELSKNR